jgi:hypothetical protein
MYEHRSLWKEQMKQQEKELKEQTTIKEKVP